MRRLGGKQKLTHCQSKYIITNMEAKSLQAFNTYLAGQQNELQKRACTNRTLGACATSVGISLEILGVVDATEKTGSSGLFVSIGAGVLTYGLSKLSRSADDSRKSAVIVAHQLETAAFDSARLDP